MSLLASGICHAEKEGEKSEKETKIGMHKRRIPRSIFPGPLEKAG
jgi:hypothetical protein